MPSAVVDVASGESGRVENIAVERGDLVQAGQVLARLESRVEQANLDLAKARADLETDIHLRESRLAFERRKLSRTDRLQTQRVVSEHEQDEVETAMQLAGWQLRKARDEKHLATLELARAEEILQRRTVTSPIDGVVVERFKWAGEYVDEEAILRVARLDPLWVEVVLPVDMYSQVAANMLAEVTTGLSEETKREARVLVVDPMADAASGTFRARLELPNADGGVLGGVKCTAQFPEPSRYAAEHPADVPVTPRPSSKAPVQVQTAPNSDEEELADQVPESPPLVEKTDEQEVVGYLVLTPRLSRAERMQLALAMRGAGLKDFALMRSGPHRGRFSLGVYNGPKSAARRQSQVSALGFTSEVVVRRKAEKAQTADAFDRDKKPSPVAPETAGNQDSRFKDRG